MKKEVRRMLTIPTWIVAGGAIVKCFPLDFEI